jgi:UDP-N-acetylglucosamine 2-epimerase (non-hydrolysing)
LPGVAYIVGARPNFVKMAPVVRALRDRAPDVRHILIHTGQHYDAAMSDVFFTDLGLPPADHVLNVGSGTHAVQTARVMERLEPVLVAEKPDLVIVPGDVNSTLAATLVAAKLCIPLAHLEAGLRSFDRTMPEEINRIVADEFSEYLLVHSDEAIANLELEGIGEERVHFVGNTMIDSLVAFEPAFRQLEAWRQHGLDAKDYVLVTLHRPAITDGPLLPDVMDRLAELATHMPVLFPMHPRTRKMLSGATPPPGVRIVDPAGYLEFLSLEAGAAAVITDSGGVQEETTFLGVPCFTLRDSTERPVTIRLGTNTLLGLNPERIADVPGLLDGRSLEQPVLPPQWDGAASERIAAVLVDRALR